MASLAKETVEGLLSSGSMSRPELVDYVHALADGADPEGWIAALEAMKTGPTRCSCCARRTCGPW